MHSTDDLSYYLKLVNRYPKIDPMVLEGYLPHEKTVILNQDDPDLFPIKVDLVWMWKKIHDEHSYPAPKGLPSPHEIDGWGLPIKDQKFRRETIPPSLLDLEKHLKVKARRDPKLTLVRQEHLFLDLMWETLSRDPIIYGEEIKFIEKMWYYRMVGKWIYIYGTPTYFPGWMHFFLNFGYVDDGRPEYRDRDRRWFIAQQLATIDCMDFVHKDPHTGKAIANIFGEYEMVDVERKVCLGTTNTKARRVGDTTKTQSIFLEMSTRMKGTNYGIQGKDANNAEDVFLKHYVRNAHKLIWFFKPIVHQLYPREAVEYRSDDSTLSMDNLINYATTADRSLYDGKRLRGYHRDEPGKVKLEDINKAHTVVKQCLTTGMGKNIVGQAFYTTTVDEMNRRGGENYAKLCRDSHYNQRTPNGQTQSGMYNIFFRASDGLVGFIDEYGRSVEGDPTPIQAKFLKSKIGAREWIENDRHIAVLNQDFEQLSELKRMYPLYFREAFTPPPKNEFFNTIILNNNYQMLLVSTDAAIQGNFYWVEKFRSVMFKPDPNGKFFMSKFFSDAEANNTTLMDGVWYPRHPDKFIASADAFRFEKTDGGRMSDGGGCVRWLFDSAVDDTSKDSESWQSARTIITYSNRPPTMIEYLEDMLMMCIYTGAMMYPEMNVTHVADYFIENNFDGFLLYDTDPATGLIKANPGFSTVTKTKQRLFNLVQTDIQRNGERNRHIDLCTECLKIPNMDAMTEFDLFTSYGGTLLGEESKMGQSMRLQMTDKSDITGWFDQFQT